MNLGLNLWNSSTLTRLLCGYVFIVSGLVINFFQLLAFLLVRPFNKKLYLKIIFNLAYSLEANLTGLVQWWSRSKLDIFTDSEQDFRQIGRESVIAVMNHSHDIDWLFFGVFFQRFGLLGSEKIVAKSGLKYIPILGWSWFFCEYVFLKREWKSDRRILANDMKKMVDYPEGYNYCVGIFCEGTRFTREKHAESMKIAREKGLPELKHHLLPRNKGFYLIASELVNHIGYLYDLNFGIIRQRDGKFGTVLDLINGEPVHGQVYIRRIPLSQVPVDNEAECSKFLQNLYQEKDRFIDEFHKNGGFEYLGDKKRHSEPNRHDLYNMIGWVVVVLGATLGFLLYAVYNFSWSFHVIMMVSIILFNALVNWFIGQSDLRKSASKFGLSAPKVTHSN